MGADLSDKRELEYLRSARAVRERAEAAYARSDLDCFALQPERLAEVAARVAAVTRAAYPDGRVPYHSRWRHFDAGGVSRTALVETRLAALAPAERLRARFDLVITSVLLDAGAGERWSFREPGTGLVLARSEGLAVASLHLLLAGALSSDPSREPARADAARLEAVTEAELARAFQVDAGNPLVGLAGRAALLRRLGTIVRETPRVFGADAPRPGNLADFLAGEAGRRGGELPAARILEVVLDALGPVWPGRERLAGVSLGDVWTHPRLGRVPFHKLSQWLTYSLVEPLEEAGLRVVGLDELTGLPEYRNGGLFLDGGVLVPRNDDVLGKTHAVGSEVVVEWRALTVALLDRVAVEVRRLLGLDAAALPLAKVLQGGTWSAGRQIAREKRADGGPPIRVESDGTVF